MDTSMLLHIPVAACETVTLVLFFKRFLEKKGKSNSPYIAAYAGYFIFNIALSILYPGILGVYSVLSCIVIPLALYKGTRTQRVFCGGLLTAYFFVSEILTMLALSLAFGLALSEFAENAFIFYAGAYTSKALSLFLAFIVSGGRKKTLSPVPFYYHLLLLFIIYICAGLSYFDVVLVNQSGNPATILHVLSETAVVVLSILVYFVFVKYQEYAERETYTAIVEQQLQQDESRFRLIDSQAAEVRGLKHDMVNHLTSIRRLSANEEYEKLNEYLDEYMQKTADVISQSITGTPSVDALLSDKIDVAVKDGIELEANTGSLPELTISPVHLNIILGNALDNAIEACRKLPVGAVRRIVLDMEAEGGWLHLRVKNSSLPVRAPGGDLPVTDKEDGANHGLGLNIVKRLVERYGGAMHCGYENGEFELIARLRQTPAG